MRIDHIELIKLGKEFSSYESTPSSNLFGQISKINIFVGANNSGKSRFMRQLSCINEFEFTSSATKNEEINKSITESTQSLINLFDKYKISQLHDLDINALRNLISGLPIFFQSTSDVYKDIRIKFKQWSTFPKPTSWTGSVGMVNQLPDSLSVEISNISKALLKVLDKVPIYGSKTERVYIPILRTLRPISSDYSDIYKEITINNYFSHQNESSRTEIFSGLSFYNRLTEMLLGDNQDRKQISEYQNFISKALFENQPIALIPNPKQKVVVVKIGKESEQMIHNLGDGIQSAIILTFLPFITQTPTLFFIEEPEMYMHPGLQRKILDYFNSNTNHIFFLTTHSNHLLDLTIDIKNISIYNFRKTIDNIDSDDISPKFKIEAVDSQFESSLELLGVRNSSVFLVNATIWVEGITDRWYLRAMINSYVHYLKSSDQNIFQPEEDNHYCFVEYGGSNIVHWSFLDYEKHPIAVERLCSKAMVIVDQDGDAKSQRKEDLKENLKDRLVILPCREIENLLPYDLICKIVLGYENTQDRILPNIRHESYQNHYLGKFIEDRILKNDFKRRGGYKSESGTLKNKTDFCERACSKIEYQELPASTQSIIIKIYEFIKNQNT